MARGKILFDGCYTHILSRSIERRWIYKEAKDFEAFKGILREIKKDYGFYLRHYCLMNTHFHLAVEIPDVETFSQGLQQAKWRYTHWYNKKYHRHGPLWRERFKSLLIEDERYLYACGLYIEHNPLKAEMVKHPEDWPHSSSGYYFARRRDELVDGYNRPAMPHGIDLDDDRSFTKGLGIGSALFRLHLKEEAQIELTVP